MIGHLIQPFSVEASGLKTWGLPWINFNLIWGCILGSWEATPSYLFIYLIWFIFRTAWWLETIPGVVEMICVSSVRTWVWSWRFSSDLWILSRAPPPFCEWVPGWEPDHFGLFSLTHAAVLSSWDTQGAACDWLVFLSVNFCAPLYVAKNLFWF